MAEKEPPPPYGPPDPTGYARGAHFTVPPGWYPQPPPVSAPAPQKSTLEKIREWVPAMVVLASVVGAIATQWRDWEAMKADTAEQRARAVEFARKLDAIGDQASKAWGAATDAAAQARELNSKLERLNLTGPRRRPRPDPATP